VPEALAAIVAAVEAVAEFLGPELTALAEAAVVSAVELGISALLAPGAPKGIDGALSLLQPLPFRRRVYGQCKMGGYFVFWTSINGSLFQLLAVAAHEIDSFIEYWVTDNEVEVNPSTHFVTRIIGPAGAAASRPLQYSPDGNPVVQIYSNTGAAGKVAYDRLVTRFPGIWTTDCIGVGIADMLLVQEGVKQGSFGYVYPGGQQTMRAVIQGAKIYDCIASPAQDPNNYATWSYNFNAVNVILDYLTHQDGWRMSKDTFLTGMGGVVTLANAAICEESVPLRSGGSEQRYRLWGWYSFDEEPRQVLNRMFASCGGWLQLFPDGTIGIYVGAWVEPTFTITDDMIIGFDAQHFVGEFDAVNEIRASFNDPQNDYQQTESTPWQNTADIELRGYIKSSTLDARFSPSYTQCRRVQKISAHETMPEYSLTLICDQSALDGRSERFLNLDMSKSLGIVGTFRVTQFVTNLVTGTCTVGLASFGSDAYAWDPSSEEGDPPPIPPDTSSSASLQQPQNLVVNVQTITTGATMAPIMDITNDPPIERTDLTETFQYQLQGDTGWTVLSKDNQDWEAKTGPLQEGTYNVRVAFVDPNGVFSSWTEVDGVVVAVSVAAPSAPTGITASVPSPAVSVLVQFDAPNDKNFDHAGVWRNSVNVFGTATNVSGPIYGSPNQALSYTDTPPSSGTWYYWATAFSVSGNQSSPDGPASVTL